LARVRQYGTNETVAARAVSVDGRTKEVLQLNRTQDMYGMKKYMYTVYREQNHHAAENERRNKTNLNRKKKSAMNKA
jgi:hypothetical protein